MSPSAQHMVMLLDPKDDAHRAACMLMGKILKLQKLKTQASKKSYVPHDDAYIQDQFKRLANLNLPDNIKISDKVEPLPSEPGVQDYINLIAHAFGAKLARIFADFPLLDKYVGRSRYTLQLLLGLLKFQSAQSATKEQAHPAATANDPKPTHDNPQDIQSVNEAATHEKEDEAIKKSQAPHKSPSPCNTSLSRKRSLDDVGSDQDGSCYVDASVKRIRQASHERIGPNVDSSFATIGQSTSEDMVGGSEGEFIATAMRTERGVGTVPTMDSVARETFGGLFGGPFCPRLKLVLRELASSYEENLVPSEDLFRITAH
ncbi:hypothetical protein PtrSN002B_011253, partial [Pyrenophora tritici-repentis]